MDVTLACESLRRDQFSMILMAAIIARLRHSSYQRLRPSPAAIKDDFPHCHIQLIIDGVNTVQGKQTVTHARGAILTTHSPDQQQGSIGFPDQIVRGVLSIDST